MPAPQYVVLPDANGTTVTVTFTDTPVVTSEGSIRKVDADDPTKGLAGAVIKIEGVDNEFTGTLHHRCWGLPGGRPLGRHAYWVICCDRAYSAEWATPPAAIPIRFVRSSTGMASMMLI